MWEHTKNPHLTEQKRVWIDRASSHFSTFAAGIGTVPSEQYVHWSVAEVSKGQSLHLSE